MPLKLYFLTSEIIPFAETGPLAHFSKYVPIRLQGHEHDIRLTAPKYGFISERKYILREVIRLREIECEMGDEIIMASAKSAFIPQTRVQVYFMEHPSWFQPLNPLLYKSRNGRPLPDNDDRFGFFGKTALNMLTHLFWSPNVILCNDWQSSFIPILYKQLYKDQDFYRNIKTVQIIHSLNDYSAVSRATYDKLGVSLPSELEGEEVNSLAIASDSADMVIAVDGPERKISKELSKHADFKAAYESIEKKLETVTHDDTSEESYRSAADHINDLLQDRFS
ncbi:MAG: glycogen/starch synthase [Candidatus Neomarinimicrobiota bacterium]